MVRHRDGTGKVSCDTCRGPGCRADAANAAAEPRTEDGLDAAAVSQDTLPSPLPIASLSKCYYTYCTTSDVYTTPVSTTIDTAVSIVFSNTVRTERSEDRHRMTPIGVLRQYTTADLNDKNLG